MTGTAMVPQLSPAMTVLKSNKFASITEDVAQRHCLQQMAMTLEGTHWWFPKTPRLQSGSKMEKTDFGIKSQMIQTKGTHQALHNTSTRQNLEFARKEEIEPEDARNQKVNEMLAISENVRVLSVQLLRHKFRGLKGGFEDVFEREKHFAFFEFNSAVRRPCMTGKPQISLHHASSKRILI